MTILWPHLLFLALALPLIVLTVGVPVYLVSRLTARGRA